MTNNGIVKESVRISMYNIPALQVTPMNFSNKHLPSMQPNVFQIRNTGSKDCYIARDPGVSNTSYDLVIASGGGTRVYVYPPGISELYAYSAGDISITVNSMYSDNIQPYDLDETAATTIINNTLTSAVEINKPLPAGSNEIGKVEITAEPIAKTPANITTALTLANTQYEIPLTNVRKFSVSLRGGTAAVKFRLSYEAGTVAAPSGDYVQYDGDLEYFEDNILFTGSLYIATDTAGQIAQVIAWS